MDLGIIEGFFGRPYSWSERTELMRFLAPHGFRFYIYAPKADRYLRRAWREAHPMDDTAALGAFAAACRDAGVAFGMGLSPFELHFDFTAEARARLADKLAAFDAIGCQWLAILFDDMRGDLPDLARRQADIVDFAAQRTGANRLLVCPSYYTDDPVLDRVFGQRPERYLSDLGRALDPAIEIMWTGEEVCSRDYSLAHLDDVAEQMGRKPFIWDNYPVNDGLRMSKHLHLRGVTGRPAAMTTHIAGLAANPASQPTLSRIPLLTLAASFAQGDRYAYGRAFRDAAREVCGDKLAQHLIDDLMAFEDGGLDGLSAERRLRLRGLYGLFEHPAAQEVVGWLSGQYAVTGETLQTQ